MATGLNFQTQTIINSNIDIDSKRVNDNGADNTWLFKAFDEQLRIKRDFVFDKECVKAIRKKEGYEAKMCKAEIDFSKISSLIPTEGVNYCGLNIYLGVEGAEPYIYSTPWVQKGMPFWLEFSVKAGVTAAEIATNVANQIKKNHLFLCDKDLITVTVNGSVLTLEGATEYQRFRKIEVTLFDVDSEYSDVIAELGDSAITLVERGLNSFGTYSQIIKDLRLPTAANYQWTHIRQVETPIVGAIYDEYIIEYAAPASNDGLQCVGQKLVSTTTHVFWVKHDSALINEWEGALAAIDTEGALLPPSEEASELE